MPKPVKKATKKAVKKAAGTLPVPPKSKRPSDPMKAAQSILAEHMGRTNEATTTAVQSFEEQYRNRMAELGAKGGKVSGAKRMQMPIEERRRIASLAARAMWAKKKAKK